MKKKPILPQPVLLLLFFAFTTAVQAQDFTTSSSLGPAEARIFATAEMPKVLQWIDPQDLQLYGFSPKDNFNKIVIGRPFHLISMEEVITAKNNRPGNVPVNRMMLPLILDNSVRCFIYLTLEEGQWKATGIGGHGYAEKSMTDFNKSDNTPSVIVAVHQANEEFIMEQTERAVVYRPLFQTDAGVSKSNYSLPELVTLYNEAVSKAKPQ